MVSEEVPMRAQEKGSSLASRIILWCLARNADRLVSLDYVPDHLRHQLSQLLCHSGRMSGHFLKLLVQGSPTELSLRDCSWLREEVFKESFQNFDPSELKVLRIGTHGHCLPDYLLPATLACSANSKPALTTLSICGAYQLRLSALVSCFLKKLEKLEDLSVEGIENICGEFIEEFISIRDHSLKELSLAECKEVGRGCSIHNACDAQLSCSFITLSVTWILCSLCCLFLNWCSNLTDALLKIIAEKCPGLRATHLWDLDKLADVSLGYPVNGCQAIRRLKLHNQQFSDECIAAFLETSGEYLEELVLNKVGWQTALSIAGRSRMLRSLDLTFCRGLTDNELGFDYGQCLSLTVLKLSECIRIAAAFINGHSSPGLKIIGFPMFRVHSGLTGRL